MSLLTRSDEEAGLEAKIATHDTTLGSLGAAVRAWFVKVSLLMCSDAEAELEATGRRADTAEETATAGVATLRKAEWQAREAERRADEAAASLALVEQVPSPACQTVSIQWPGPFILHAFVPELAPAGFRMTYCLPLHLTCRFASCLLCSTCIRLPPAF